VRGRAWDGGRGGEGKAGAERRVWINPEMWGRMLDVSGDWGFASMEEMKSAISLGIWRNGFR